MIFTLVERRRVDFDKLTQYDTVVAATTTLRSVFENYPARPAPYNDDCHR